jgi:hypothetical protein
VAFQVVLSHLLGTQATGQPLKEKDRSAAVSRSHAKGPRILRNGPSEWVGALIDEGFFVKPRVIGDVVNRLAEVRHTVLSKDVSYPLARFAELRRLRRTKSGNDKAGRPVWIYTNY